MPQVSSLEDFTPPSSTRIYAADGSLLAEFATQKRTPVAPSETPPNLVKALLAVEDHRFFNHMGINLGRILKAAWVDLRKGRIVEGASTITQQLAKVLFLTPEKTLTRKIREALLALEIERQYSKEEILAFYLNQIYLGNRAYGVAAAAEVYFAKSVGDLSLAECALLAALPKAPAVYDPFQAPDRARQRRDLVLSRMTTLGWVDPDAATRARAEPLPTARTPKREITAPYFVEAVRRRLLERLELDFVYEGGLRVYTTLQPGLQRAAEKAVLRALAAVDARHPRKSPPAQGAALALDPATGAVRALVGGRDWWESPFDRSLQARRQPGSSFKLFDYLAALESGLTQASTTLDAPASYPGASPRTPWRPKNYDGKYRGLMTLRQALALSRNLPAVRVMEAVGKRKVDEIAQRLGLEGTFGEGLASALGVGQVSLLELVRAYAAVSAGGMLPTPHWIRAVYGPDGRNLWPGPPAPRRVLDPATAYVATDMLRAVVDAGTGRKARALPFRLAGKTGTTDDQRDAWFVGFSSGLAAGVWVGRDDFTPLGWGETGAKAALPVWIDMMLAAAAESPPRPWSVPEGITFVEIDLASGLKAGPRCKNTAYAAFVRGTEPNSPCDREAFQWEHVVSRLAVGITPRRKGNPSARPWARF
jgi:penicillin-binding protein 1A